MKTALADAAISEKAPELRVLMAREQLASNQSKRRYATARAASAGTERRITAPEPSCNAAGSASRHKLVKAADLAVLRLFLMKKCQAGFIELVKEFVPANLLQPGFPGAEIDPEHSGMPVLLSFLHGRRNAMALLNPFSDRSVICGGVAFTHCRSV